MQNALRQNHDVFAWAHSDMKGIDPSITSHNLTSCQQPDPSGKGFPLPRIDQIVDSTAKQGMLSFLDAFSGYHQIPMSPADIEKTAFITPHGLYCYKVMSFGLKNAGATYQRLMTKIFKPLIDRSVDCWQVPGIHGQPKRDREWAINAVLFRCPSPKEQKPIYYVSRALADVETRYSKMELTALTLRSAAQKLHPYFQAHSVVVLTDQPLRNILHKQT
ncbi:Transposon Ty3-G Gag-Pol polyprotein [Vitis vinifera]|uniref:Transposon Ty3-G Gag-Pol polyprotein n=1 Tax=Vitis vinifera TaxID=29760 RepID=A0A438K2N7_VITVI|nr:Transposon Ty3-G Gag-Pol polyprotein [Vitis vinifera]